MRNIAIVLIIIGLSLIGVAVYKLFIEKPQNNNLQEQENNSSEKENELETSDGLITELTKYKLNESNKEFKLPNATIKLKNVGDKLYINDSAAKVKDYDGENKYTYDISTKQLIKIKS